MQMQKITFSAHPAQRQSLPGPSWPGDLTNLHDKAGWGRIKQWADSQKIKCLNIVSSTICTIMQADINHGGNSLEELQPEGTQDVSTTDVGPYHPTSGERVSLARTFGGRSLLREILETILLTVIIFLVLNATTGRFQVRGFSMEPTLHDGQYMIISKLIYWIHPPERGDVIVFHPPNSLDDDYIKRIVGLPGEKIEIRRGEIAVDGVLLEEPYIVNPGFYSGTWDLGDEEYFVLGDNRRNSSDSHTWGVFPQDNIVGKAWLCYWPPEEWSLVAHHTFSKPTDQGD